MKIVVISQMFPCRRHPTSAIFFANLMRELAARVEEVIVVTPRPNIPKPLAKLKPGLSKWFRDEMYSTRDGLEIFRPFVLSIPSPHCAGVNAVLMHRALRRFLKPIIEDRGIEIILGYNMIPEGIAAVNLARDFGLPAGFWVIGSDLNAIAGASWLNASRCRKAIAASNVVFTESKDLEQRLWAFSNYSPNIKTFYKGIDVANFVNLPPKPKIFESLKLDRRRRYLLFVGRLMQSKGIDELATAFLKIAQRYADFDLILIGEEIERPRLYEKFAGAGLLPRVHFMGVVPHAKVAEFMKAADLLVFPSWAEGLPNVVMEAMAVGLPVVASNVGGTPEILLNEVTGLAVPAKNPNELLKAITKMIEDMELREGCVRSAQSLVLENFDVRKNVEILIDHLQQLVPRRAMEYSYVRSA
jgi:glycosyltransferase involved in cell wall biosynthesis